MAFGAIGTTYSFKDLQGALQTVLSGTLLFGGTIGVGAITVTNDTEHGLTDTAADGTVMPTFAAGDAGKIMVECQQTSGVHQFLLAWYNTLKTSAMNGDVSNWASSSLYLRNIVDGSQHECIGVMPSKVPDKPYKAQGERITWTLVACNIQNL